MKAVLLLMVLTTSFTATSQLKRFSIDAFLSKANFNDGYKVDYAGYFARIQYAFPKVFSVNIGYGIEHQSFRNTTTNDIPTYVSWNSKVRTKENCIPIALRATIGRKLMLFAEAGVVFHFKSTSHWEGIEDYQDNSIHQDSYYDVTHEMNNSNQLFYSAGISYPVYKGLRVFGEFRKRLGKQDRTFPTYDDLYFLPKHVSPDSRYKLCFGLSYNFNLKKESTYTFKTWYIKSTKTRE